MFTGQLAENQMLLSEFYIVYVTYKVIKSQALADHLVKIPSTKSMNLLRLVVRMNKYCLWLKIFLKHIKDGNYPLTEQQNTKEEVSDLS